MHACIFTKNFPVSIFKPYDITIHCVKAFIYNIDIMCSGIVIYISALDNLDFSPNSKMPKIPCEGCLFPLLNMAFSTYKLHNLPVAYLCY